jgi:hypothetical protein
VGTILSSQWLAAGDYFETWWLRGGLIKYLLGPLRDGVYRHNCRFVVSVSDVGWLAVVNLAIDILAY